MTEHEALSPEEFERWLSAPQAIETLRPYLHPDEAAIAVWSALQLSEIRSAARRIEAPRQTFPARAIIPAKWWQKAAALEQPIFWKTSSIEIREGTGESFISTRVAALVGVRFDPAGIDLLLGDLAPATPAQPATDASVRPLSRAPSVKAAPPPPDDEIRQMIRTVHAEGVKGRAIPKAVRAKPGFEAVSYKNINALAEGLFARVGRAGSKKE